MNNKAIITVELIDRITDSPLFQLKISQKQPKKKHVAIDSWQIFF